MDNLHNTYEKCYYVNRIELWVLWMFPRVDGTCHHGGRKQKQGTTELPLDAIMDTI